MRLWGVLSARDRSDSAGNPMHVSLHDSAISGNAYKVRLLLTHPRNSIQAHRLQCRRRFDLNAGLPEEEPNGRCDAWSLKTAPACGVQRHSLLPGARHRLLAEVLLDQAQALQWMFFEQYSHEPYGRRAPLGGASREDAGERAAATGQDRGAPIRRWM